MCLGGGAGVWGREPHCPPFPISYLPSPPLTDTPSPDTSLRTPHTCPQRTCARPGSSGRLPSGPMGLPHLRQRGLPIEPMGPYPLLWQRGLPAVHTGQLTSGLTEGSR